MTVVRVVTDQGQLSHQEGSSSLLDPWTQGVQSTQLAMLVYSSVSSGKSVQPIGAWASNPAMWITSKATPATNCLLPISRVLPVKNTVPHLGLRFGVYPESQRMTPHLHRLLALCLSFSCAFRPFLHFIEPAASGWSITDPTIMGSPQYILCCKVCSLVVHYFMWYFICVNWALHYHRCWCWLRTYGQERQTHTQNNHLLL